MFEMSWAIFDTSTVASLPILSFAFTFHPNIFPVWEEMKDTKKENILKVTWVSVFIACTLYFLVSSLGYLAFPLSVRDNILLELKGDVFVEIGKMSYALIICFSFPMLAFPLRRTIDQTLFPGQQQTQLRVTIEALAVYSISLLLGLVFPTLSVVFGLTGATAGAIILFLLPSSCYLHLKKNERENYGKLPWWIYRYFWIDKLGALFLFLLGLFVMTLGTLSVLYNLFSGK